MLIQILTLFPEMFAPVTGGVGVDLAAFDESAVAVEEAGPGVFGCLGVGGEGVGRGGGDQGGRGKADERAAC